MVCDDGAGVVSGEDEASETEAPVGEEGIDEFDAGEDPVELPVSEVTIGSGRKE